MVLIIKRILSFFLALSLVWASCPAASAAPAPAVNAQCAVVMHADGEIVWEKNADEPMLIASTTKIMTALVVLDCCRMAETVRVAPECCGIEGSSMYLKPGQEITVEKLLLGLLLVSGNDAAAALAVHCAGSIEAFAARMNEKAAELGMEHTHFSNPHGLNAEGHYSTANDMAKLMCRAMENKDFADVISRRSFAEGEMVYLNHNKLLYSLPGCLGGKTGYTVKAGRCLVSCCEREGTRFVCVTLSDPDDWNDHISLYEWAFSEYSDRDMSAAACFSVPVAGGESDSVNAVPGEKLTVFVRRDRELAITAELPRFVLAPVKAGERAGKATVYCDGQLLAECPLVYDRDVNAAK